MGSNQMETSESIHHEMTIDTDAATIFAFFTDPERLIRWMGVAAKIQPQRGGIMLVEVHPGRVARGEFKEVIPVSRLAYTFGWEGGEKVPPGSSLIEIDLMPKNGSTLVRFTHSELPPEEVAPHREGWNHYLGRLAIAAAGGDPGPDPRLQRT
jgi:uncharacterized protein YndB with AHSA1/START domain